MEDLCSERRCSNLDGPSFADYDFAPTTMVIFYQFVAATISSLQDQLLCPEVTFNLKNI